MNQNSVYRIINKFFLLLKMHMTPLQKVKLCLFINIVLLAIIISCITLFAIESKYFRFGPNEDFVLISIAINTRIKYATLLSIISVMNIIKVLIAELGEPVLVFNVYNPDKKIVTDFTKTQLLFYSNAMFFVSNTRRVFEVMITVTQFDIAVFSILVEQFASIGTVCFLVNEKKFEKNISNKEDEQTFLIS